MLPACSPPARAGPATAKEGVKTDSRTVAERKHAQTHPPPSPLAAPPVPPPSLPPPPPLALRRQWRSVGGRIFDVAFSPTAEFELATAGEDCGLVWSVEEGAAPSLRLKLAQPAVRCAWHPAGGHVITGGTDGRVTVWSAKDGSSLASLRAAPKTED